MWHTNIFVTKKNITAVHFNWKMARCPLLVSAAVLTYDLSAAEQNHVTVVFFFNLINGPWYIMSYSLLLIRNKLSQFFCLFFKFNTRRS